MHACMHTYTHTNTWRHTHAHAHFHLNLNFQVGGVRRYDGLDDSIDFVGKQASLQNGAEPVVGLLGFS